MLTAPYCKAVILDVLLPRRCKKIEATICNGDAAFLAVRVQQVVIEFILNHADQIFNSGAPGPLQQDGNGSLWPTPHTPHLLY